MANREKFWIEKKGKAAKWLPSNGFFIGGGWMKRGHSQRERQKLQM